MYDDCKSKKRTITRWPRSRLIQNVQKSYWYNSIWTGINLAFNLIIQSDMHFTIMLSFPHRYRISSWTQSKSLARKKAEGTRRAEKGGCSEEEGKGIIRKEGTEQRWARSLVKWSRSKIKISSGKDQRSKIKDHFLRNDLRSKIRSFQKITYYINRDVVQPADIGWPTGNGKELSNSQACCLAQLCLEAA